jgi:hypothetical protein
MVDRYVHPLAAALVTDPANPPDLIPIKGYVGPVDDENVTRLFRDDGMNLFVDVRAEHVVYRDRLPISASSPWGEDVIWVARENVDNLREESTSLAAGADDATDNRTAAPGNATGTVFNINVGGNGVPTTGGEAGKGIGGGGRKGPRLKFRR